MQLLNIYIYDNDDSHHFKFSYDDECKLLVSQHGSIWELDLFEHININNEREEEIVEFFSNFLSDLLDRSITCESYSVQEITTEQHDKLKLNYKIMKQNRIFG